VEGRSNTIIVIRHKKGGKRKEGRGHQFKTCRPLFSSQYQCKIRKEKEEKKKSEDTH